ncbi:hypothetical protein NIES4103_59910 [Nostoc sp. NIES-4103]|nr:hypothetical protein NIES4103_59910 [Nostoc sp. NIES-4103]
MEPEVFLEQKDVVPLTKVLIQVLMQNNIASDRYSLLDNAGIDAALIAGSESTYFLKLRSLDWTMQKFYLLIYPLQWNF